MLITISILCPGFPRISYLLFVFALSFRVCPSLNCHSLCFFQRKKETQWRRLAQERQETARRWPENVPPVPDWTSLDGATFHLDDLPKDYKDDENPCLLELAALDLELTEEQKHMLRPPEERIKAIEFPHALMGRIKRYRGKARKSRWAAKFHGRFVGMVQTK